MKKKGEMIPGKRYKGYGFINEFNEFMFEPEATGSRAGAIKQICVRDGVSVSETKNYVLIHLKVAKKKERRDLIVELTRTFNQLLKIVREYDI